MHISIYIYIYVYMYVHIHLYVYVCMPGLQGLLRLLQQGRRRVHALGPGLMSLVYCIILYSIILY